MLKIFRHLRKQYMKGLLRSGFQPLRGNQMSGRGHMQDFSWRNLFQEFRTKFVEASMRKSKTARYESQIQQEANFPSMPPVLLLLHTLTIPKSESTTPLNVGVELFFLYCPEARFFLLLVFFLLLFLLLLPWRRAQVVLP